MLISESMLTLLAGKFTAGRAARARPACFRGVRLGEEGGGLIYKAEVTDCSLIEREENTHRRGAARA